VALQNYAEMRAAAARLGDRSMDLAGLLATATLHSISESVPDAAKGEELSNAGLKLALELGDRAAESKALWNLMLVHLWLVEDPPRAIAYGEQSLAIARELNLEEQVAYTTMDLGAAYFSVGQLDQAEEKRDAASRLWTALGNQPMLAYNLGAYMMLLLMRSKYDKLFQVGEEIEQGMQAFTSRRDHGTARGLLSYVWVDRGEYTKALEVLEQGLRDFVEEQHPVLMDLGRATLFWYYAALGATENGMNLYRMLRRPDADVMHSGMETMIRVLYALFEIASGQLTTAETTLSYCKPAPASPWAVWVQHAQSRLAFGQGDYVRAVSVAGAAADRMGQMQMHQFLADVLYVKGQAHAKLGERDAAKMVLVQARAEAEAFGCRRMLWQILLALAALEDDPGVAGALRAQACEVIEFISAHTPPDLRAGFMKQTEVSG
jgi:tetratricopeptide (TPR) repeat protein